MQPKYKTSSVCFELRFATCTDMTPRYFSFPPVPAWTCVLYLAAIVSRLSFPGICCGYSKSGAAGSRLGSSRANQHDPMDKERDPCVQFRVGSSAWVRSKCPLFRMISTFCCLRLVRYPFWPSHRLRLHLIIIIS
jgi:hypothetical protein